MCACECACECACRLTTMAYTSSQKDPACVGGRAESSTSTKRSKWVPAVPSQAEEATRDNEHVNVNANLINSSCGGEGPSPVPAGLLCVLGAWSTGLDPPRPFPLYLSKSFPPWTQEPKGSTPRTDQLPRRKNTHQSSLQNRNNKCETKREAAASQDAKRCSCHES